MDSSLMEYYEPSKIHRDYFSACEKCVCFNVKWESQMMSYYMVPAGIPYASPSKCYPNALAFGLVNYGHFIPLSIYSKLYLMNIHSLLMFCSSLIFLEAHMTSRPLVMMRLLLGNFACFIWLVVDGILCLFLKRAWFLLNNLARETAKELNRVLWEGKVVVAVVVVLVWIFIGLY